MCQRFLKEPFLKTLQMHFRFKCVIPIYSTKGFRDDRFCRVAFYVIKIRESQCVSILTPSLLACAKSCVLRHQYPAREWGICHFFHRFKQVLKEKSESYSRNFLQSFPKRPPCFFLRKGWPNCEFHALF